MENSFYPWIAIGNANISPLFTEEKNQPQEEKSVFFSSESGRMLATTDAVLKGKRTGGQATTGACLRERAGAAEVTRRTALRRRGRGFSTCSTSTRTTTTTWSTQRTPTRTSVQANAQSSRTEYEGDLSASLLLGLSDAELENLASEYEYDIESKKLGGELVFEGDDEVEVDAHYEGISDEEAEAESRAFALTLADALDEVKVQDIKLLHVGPYVSGSFFSFIFSFLLAPFFLTSCLATVLLVYIFRGSVCVLEATA